MTAPALVLLVVAIVQLVALHVRLWRSDRLRVQSSLHDATALDALHAQASARADRLVGGIKTFHEDLERCLRAELGVTNLHARKLEERARASREVLPALCKLLQELREMLDKYEPAPRGLSGEPLRKVLEVVNRDASIPPPPAAAPLVRRPTLLGHVAPPRLLTPLPREGEPGEHSPTLEDATTIFDASGVHNKGPQSVVLPVLTAESGS